MRIIDADILIAELKESALHHCNNPREDSLLQRDRVIVRAQPAVEAIPKDQYEARLKSDMIAMLTDIQLEIEELDSNHTMPDVWSNQASKEIWNTALKLIEEIIEVRINNLKGMTKECEESG